MLGIYRIFYHIMDPIMISSILLKLFKHSRLSEFCSWGKDCLDYMMKNQGNIIPKGAGGIIFFEFDTSKEKKVRNIQYDS